MGMFDGGGFNFGDPQSMALLGMLQGLGQASAASRLPVTFGSALGSLAGGAMQGAHAGYDMQTEQMKGKLLEAQALEAQRRGSVLGQLDLSSIFGQPSAPGQTPITTPGARTSMGGPQPQYKPPAAGVGGAVARSAAVDALGLSMKLRQMGYSPVDAAAVLGNAAAESSLDPANASGDGGTSQGLFQWHAPERKAGLLDYAQKTGRPWTDPHLQLEYMDKELRQKAPEFFQAPDLATKTKIFQDKFEIPKYDTSGHRTQLAQNFLGQMSGTDAGPAGPGGRGSMAVQPGAGALNIDPIALARLRAQLGLGGIGGDPLKGFADAYYNSPQYRRAVAEEEGWAKVPPELYKSWHGPEADPALQGNIARARSLGELPQDLQKQLFGGKVDVAKASNMPVTVSPGQKTEIDPTGERVPWPTIPGMPGMAVGGATGLPGAGGAPGVPAGTGAPPAKSGPIVIEGGSQAQESLERELGTSIGKDLAERRSNSLAAVSSMENGQVARNLLDKGVITGAGANWKLALGKALQTSGIHLTDDAVANTEAYMAARAQETKNIIKAFGSSSAVSDTDREYTADMVAGRITLTEKSMRDILDILDRVSTKYIQQYNTEAGKVPRGSAPFPLEIPIPEGLGRKTTSAEGSLPGGQPAAERKTIGGTTYERRNGQWGVVGGR